MAKAKKSEQMLTVPTTIEQVPAAIEQLKKKLKVLKGEKDERIDLNVNYMGTNIKNVSTVSELLEISSSIHARGKAYNEEIKRYNLQEMKIAPFKVDKKSTEEWGKIIDKAIHDLINKKQIEKLETSIKKLSKHLDEETKLKNELESIMALATEDIE